MSPGTARHRRARRSVRGQLLLLAGALLTIVVAASVVLVVTVVQSDRASTNARQLSRARGDAAQAVAALLMRQSATLGVVLEADPDRRAAVATAQAAFATRVAALRSDLPAGAGVAPQVDALVAASARYDATVTAPALAAAAAGDTVGARRVVTGPDAATVTTSTQAAAGSLWSALDAAYARAVTTSVAVRARLTGLIVGVLVTLLLAILAAVVIVRRSVVVPLLAMQAAVRRVAGGAWDDDVPAAGPTEVRALAVDVDAMRRALLSALDGERRAAEALDQNGPAVLALRDALAPSPWTQPGFESAGRLDPVEGLLAGDWYDVVALGDHRVGLVLGDVAGHGAASGVYALRLKGMLRGALLAGLAPSTALASIAAHVTRFPDDPRVESGELFATAFVAVVDREVGELVYASAGHLEAVVMRAVAPGADRGDEDAPASVVDGLWDQLDLPPTGPMLSTLLADRIWTERRHRFGPRDLLVVATDGVIEARDPAQTEYGLGRIVDRLGARLVLGDGLDAAVDAVFSDVAGFERTARDDRTLVALRSATVRRRFGATRVGSARPVRPA